MILIFADETSDNKFKDYFGISIAVINSNYYSPIKQNFHKILEKSKWDTEIEFKGSCLFSETKGDTNISIDERINICSDLLKLNKSKHNARIKFYYVVIEKCDKQKEAYLKYLPKLLNKALKKTSKKGGKNILTIQCDQRPDTSSTEIRNAVQQVIIEKGYTLLEDVIMSKSGFETVGLLYADIVGYLFSRVDTISNDSELFTNLSEEQMATNGKYLKLKSSTELMKLIKDFKAYEVKSK